MGWTRQHFSLPSEFGGNHDYSPWSTRHNQLLGDLSALPVSFNAPSDLVRSTPIAADLSTLVKDLKDKDAKVRAEAVRRLTGLGETAKPAIPALVQALGDSDAKVRHRAVRLLVIISWPLPGQAKRKNYE